MRFAAIAAVLALLVACDNKTSSSTGATNSTSTGAATGAGTGAGAAASSVPKGEMTYYFGFNPVRNKVTFHSKNDISNILGSSSYVNGSATINFEAGTGTCLLSIPAVSLQSDYTDRDRAMHGPTWLDVKKYPNVEFKGEKATLIEQPNIWKIDGKLTLRGVTKDTSITAKVRPLSEAIGKKFNLGDGPCLKVESEFKVKLADHGIVIPETAIATVQPEISIGIDIWGSTVKPADPSAPPELGDGPGMRPPKVVADGITGTIYELGKKPQFSIISAVSETDIETITTKSNVLKGYVGIDAAAGIGKVRLAIASESLDTGIKLRNEHLHGPQWLDSKQFKTIEFESTKATKKSETAWAVEGDFTMHGVKKPLTVEVQLRPIPVEKVKAAKWGETPAIAFSAKFTLKLSDFGVKINEQAAGKVSDELKVAIELIGLEKPKE